MENQPGKHYVDALPGNYSHGDIGNIFLPKILTGNLLIIFMFTILMIKEDLKIYLKKLKVQYLDGKVHLKRIIF